MALKGKMQAYAEARAQGLRPMAAAAHAGYAGSGIRVTTSRIEARTDIQTEIKRLKRGGKKETEAPEADDDELETWGMKNHYESPLALLEDVMNNPKAPKTLRYQAAKDALPYRHARKEGGKKEETKDKAKAAGRGHYGTTQRPSHMRAN